jgi:hypothetical protein
MDLKIVVMTVLKGFSVQERVTNYDAVHARRNTVIARLDPGFWRSASSARTLARRIIRSGGSLRRRV